MMIRRFTAEDFQKWTTLWLQNNQGHVDESITAHTWERLLDQDDTAVNGLGFFLDDKTMAGFVHYILHPVTGHMRPACYMQDLFVDPAHRKRGIGRALVEHLAALGRDQNWARLYWLAENKNEAAQALYKNLGVKLDFSFYVLPLF